MNLGSGRNYLNPYFSSLNIIYHNIKFKKTAVFFLFRYVVYEFHCIWRLVTF